MSGDDAKIFEKYAAEEVVFEYLLARLRIDAGNAAASLLAAATDHAREHGNGDTWTIAAVEAAEALADIAASGLLVQTADENADENPRVP